MQGMKLLSEYQGFQECVAVQDLAGCTPLYYATLTRSYECVRIDIIVVKFYVPVQMLTVQLSV